jgi:hypothetical protein
LLDGGAAVELDGKKLEGNLAPLFEDGSAHEVVIRFE